MVMAIVCRLTEFIEIEEVNQSRSSSRRKRKVKAPLTDISCLS